MTADFPFNTPGALRDMDRAHHLHPWTNFGPFEDKGALVITKGQGCYLWDAQGRRYFDAVGGMWCTNIGLGRRDMAEAIADQVQRLAFANSFVDMTNGPAARLAAKLAQLAPGDLNRVHFTTGGSTAVDTAVRMVSFTTSAKGNPTKTGIVARDYSYHGSTYLTQSVGKRNRRPHARNSTTSPKASGTCAAPTCYRRPDGMTRTRILRSSGGRISRR
ncbi:MAG: aminotransferase class III-fold pyridoxal phosphate-dependent enzyme [Gemmobacter sp.]|nr:aminotransferase class III-fold pyridoxal phosphate-dependent enzyme [Gemmobacter sp.]